MNAASPHVRRPPLTAEQATVLAAIEQFIRGGGARPTFAVHGLAGVGKTRLLAEVAHRHPDAIVCAPTGKAADVLQRKCGVPAATVHHAFKRLHDVTVNAAGRRDLAFVDARRDGAMAGQIVLLDEASMVSVDLAESILRTGARIVAFGDQGQLPPVKGDPYFNTPDAVLHEIHRQALESQIICQAHRVRCGLPYEGDGEAFRVRRGALSDEEMRLADVVLTWRNTTKDAANQHCRKIRGLWRPHPTAGEPIVCLKNAADFGLYNGSVHTLTRDFLEGDSKIALDIDGREVVIPTVTFAGVASALREGQEALTSFDYGYAMTVHKAQGSEWENVILIDEYNRRDDRARWLYTALTRASERILVLR